MGQVAMTSDVQDSGWAELELAIESSGAPQRRAVTNLLLAQALRAASAASAYAPRRSSMENASPGDAVDILRALPVQSGTDLIERSSEYSIPRPGPLKTARTSGSSGRSIEVSRSRHEFPIEQAYVDAAWRRLGVPPGAKGAVLVGRALPDGDHTLRPGGMLWISCLRRTADVWRRVSELLSMHRPDYIRGYGSLVGDYFAFLAAEGSRAPSVSAVAYSSDFLLPHHRDAIVATMGKPPIGLYGQVERSLMAVTCETSDEYHLFETYGRMELLDDDGRPIEAPGVEGDIVGTSLWPRATAIVRYRTGDRGAWVQGSCACGRTQPRFKLIVARSRDVLTDVDGEQWIFGPAIYEAAIQSLPATGQIQFSHPEPGVLVVRLPGASSEAAAELERLLDQTLGGAFALSIVDQEPVHTGAGKRLLLELPAGHARERSTRAASMSRSGIKPAPPRPPR